MATLSGEVEKARPENLLLTDPEQVGAEAGNIDLNPYASPQIGHAVDAFPEDDRFAPDLSPEGERRARAIVSDAEFIWTTLLFGFLCCWPVWPLALPWYCFRLYGWHRLNKQFAELRHPNSLSQHGDLAARFQDAKRNLWICIGAGLFGCILFAIAVLGIWDIQITD